MAKVPKSWERFSGISDFHHESVVPDSYYFGRSIDVRTEPHHVSILPRTLKESGTVVTDLIKWADVYNPDLDVYFYGDTGNFYKRTTDRAYSLLRSINTSHGNGLCYNPEDNYFHYTTDKTIGRYGNMTSDSPQFDDNFLGSRGGVPLNTNSLNLESGSSQYAYRADTASLSITGDLAIEAQIKPESLPTIGNTMTLVSKWNGSGDIRSYKFDIACVSGYFGDGSDGALTISSNTTEAPIDAACTGTSGAFTLTATNASFAEGQIILIHQTQGTNAGTWQRNTIASYTAGTITLFNALNATYTSKSQVRVLKQYTNVTINSDKTYTAKAWNGTVGGILTFLTSGTVTVTGTITADGKGFSGASQPSESQAGHQGEGTGGAEDTHSTVANGNGGGGGYGVTTNHMGGGGGGGNGTAGTKGVSYGGGIGGTGGLVKGSADLTTIVFGGGGGSGGIFSGGGDPEAGGNGGGIIFVIGATVTITGTITADGSTGTGGSYDWSAGGGGGAGGSILIKAQTATLGTTKIGATGGAGGNCTGVHAADGGAGGSGRVHLDYYTSYTGTTTPTLNVTKDDTLVTNLSYQLRFSVASSGTAATSETLSKTLLSTPTLSQWYRYAVKWDASASKAYFYVDGNYLGYTTGTKTAIYDGTALLAIGASFSDAGEAEKFFDGKVDDIRIWNDLRTDNELLFYKDIEVAGGSTNLQAYYEVDNSTADSSANTNTLTLVNSPVYSTNVPFASPTSRRDLDQSLNTSGQAYTLATTIDEGATHRQTFVPTKEPLKSIEVLLATKGTGDWTLTIHDGLNKTITSKTIVNANLLAAAGDLEFIFDTPARLILGASYHFHLTSTVADGTVTTTTTVDLETVDYHSYYQFLVDDDFHPIGQIVNKLAIGNERYIATWDGVTYTPCKLTLPSGYRIRCLGHWREYLAIGTMRGTNIEDYDQGRLFFWDGYSTTYNFYIDIPQGAINAISSGDPIYFMAGYSGDLMRYSGGFPQKILRMPNIVITDTFEINRKALAMYRALIHIGLAEDSSSTTLERGVYSYGSLHSELPETLSFDYPLSLEATTGTGIEIGMLFPIGDSLFISWRNESAYGVDSVNPSNDRFPTAKIEFLVTDNGNIWAEKQANVIRAYFKKLVDGDSVQLKYKIDRNDNWTEGDTVTTADEKEARLSLPTKGSRFNEFQVGINLETTGATTPEIYGWAIEIDDLKRERRT